MRPDDPSRPISLRISVTDRCQLRCRYCMPPEGIAKRGHDEILRFEQIVRFVRILKSHFGLAKVHLTGGEPLVRPGIVDLIAMLADEGIDDLALTTNGQALADLAAELKDAGLRRVNVSLDTLRADRYTALTRGGELDRTLQGIEAARHCGLTPIKFNVAVLKGINDDELVDLAEFGMKVGSPVRFLEIMPIGAACPHHDEWFVSSDQVRQTLAAAFELRAIPGKSGSSTRYYSVRNDGRADGTIGFISSRTEPFCRGCLRLRLTSTGELIGCLARGEGPAIGPLLRDETVGSDDELVRAVREAITLKRTDRHFTTTKSMGSIGG